MGQRIDPLKPEDIEIVPPTKPLRHLAREGETEFAVICRQRSGFDAGSIDFAFPHATAKDLCPAEQRELIDTVYALARSIEDCLKATAEPKRGSE